MARTTPHLGLYLYEEGETHEPVLFTNESWQAVDAVFGYPIPLDLRDRIAECCDRYASSRHVELHIQSVVEAERELDALQKKLRPFVEFAFSSGWHGTEKATISTRNVVSDAWKEALASQPFRIDASKVSRFSADTDTLEPLSRSGDARVALVNLDDHVLGEVAQSLTVAIEVAKQRLRSAGEGFVPRQALMVWMTEVRDALDSFNAENAMRLPVGAYASETDRSDGQEPGPFSRMLFELHRHIPDVYREQLVNSPAAMAARYKRALKDRSRLARATRG